MRSNGRSLNDFQKPTTIGQGSGGKGITLASKFIRSENRTYPIEQSIENRGSTKARDMSRLLACETEAQARITQNLENALAEEDYSQVTDLMRFLESTNRYPTILEHQVVELRHLKSGRPSNR